MTIFQVVLSGESGAFRVPYLKIYGTERTPTTLKTGGVPTVPSERFRNGTERLKWSFVVIR